MGTLGSAAMMYLMDPEKGNERRATLREQVTRFFNKATTQTESLIEQISDRAQGAAADATRKLSGAAERLSDATMDRLSDATGENVSDEVMVARVRSAMGHVLTNAHDVEVLANQGLITLTGSVPSAETEALITTIKALPGVHGVENRLEAYEGTTDIS